MSLDRESIFAITDRPLRSKEISVPELGGDVFVRVMTGTERDRFEEIHVLQKHRNFRARTAVFSVCDSAGKLLFTEVDVDRVGRLPAKALDRIFEESSALNGLTEEDVNALAGKSQAAPTEG